MDNERVKVLSNENGTLRIGIDDRIDTNNALQIEQELDTILKDKEFNNLILDFYNLEYISSIGIRILIKLMKTYGNLSIENASLEVGDILKTTGIDTIIPIQKKLREFSTEGLEVIGAGANGAVYRLDDETILKVINNWNSLDDIQRERDSAQKAFLMGIPSAISFDVVKVDDKHGIIYELLNSKSLDKELVENPDKIELYGIQFGQLGRNLSSNNVDDEEMADKKEDFFELIDSCHDMLDEEVINTVKNLFDTIPARNNYVHGDFHPENVLLQGDELLLIDFSYAGKGHPVVDLITFTHPVICSLIGRPETDVSKFTGLTVKQNFELWDAFLRGYLNTTDSELLDWIKEQLLILVHAKSVANLADRVKSFKKLNINSSDDAYNVAFLENHLNDEIETLSEVAKDFDVTLYDKLDELLENE